MNRKNKDLLAIIICGVLLVIWIILIISGVLVINKKPIHGNPITATITKRFNESKNTDGDLFTYTITVNYNDNGTEKNLDLNRVNVKETQSNAELLGKSIHIMPVSDTLLATSTNDVVNYSDDDSKIGIGLVSTGSILLAITFFTGIFFMWSYFRPAIKSATDIDMELDAKVDMDMDN